MVGFFVTAHYQTAAGKEKRGRETDKDTATMAEKEALDGWMGAGAAGQKF